MYLLAIVLRDIPLGRDLMNYAPLPISLHGEHDYHYMAQNKSVFVKLF
jgi:hypothetical protein